MALKSAKDPTLSCRHRPGRGNCLPGCLLHKFSLVKILKYYPRVEHVYICIYVCSLCAYAKLCWAGRRAPMRFAKCHAHLFCTASSASSHEQSRVFYTQHKMSFSHACPTPSKWKCNCIRRPQGSGTETASRRERERGRGAWHTCL